MVLLGETFHDSGEGLNLSLEGGGVWLVSLNIIGCRHRASKYLQLFVWEAIVWLTSRNFFPQMVLTDDAKNRQ